MIKTTRMIKNTKIIRTINNLSYKVKIQQKPKNKNTQSNPKNNNI